MTDMPITLTCTLDELALAIHKTRYGNEDPDFDMSVAKERARWVLEILDNTLYGRAALDHVHEWVSAVNEVVESGYVCTTPGCGAISAEGPNAD